MCGWFIFFLGTFHKFSNINCCNLSWMALANRFNLGSNVIYTVKNCDTKPGTYMLTWFSIQQVEFLLCWLTDRKWHVYTTDFFPTDDDGHTGDRSQDRTSGSLVLYIVQGLTDNALTMKRTLKLIYSMFLCMS
jgi:hypothetical protein